jgi:lipocalin
MLGPYNADGLYDYAVVSDNHDSGLYVLARDPAVFASQYDAEVTAFLSANGFTGKLNTPVPTVQTSNCHYADAPVYVDPAM